MQITRQRIVWLTDTYQYPEELCDCWADDRTPTEAPPHIEEEHRIAANLRGLESRCSVCDLEWSGQHNGCGFFRTDGSRDYAYPRILATTTEGETVEVCCQV